MTVVLPVPGGPWMNTASPALSRLSNPTARFCGLFGRIPLVSHEDSASDSSLGAMIVSGLTRSCASSPTPKSLVAMAASTERFAW